MLAAFHRLFKVGWLAAYLSSVKASIHTGLADWRLISVQRLTEPSWPGVPVRNLSDRNYIKTALRLMVTRCCTRDHWVHSGESQST